jgi:tryptophanase
LASRAAFVSCRRFEQALRELTELTGFTEALSVHRGRAAERIVLSCLLKPAK